MRRARAWIWRLLGTFAARRRDRDLAAELESHLQLHLDDGIRAGLSEAEARRQARLKLGGVEVTREAYRARAGVPWLDALARDVRFAIRQLRRSPGFAAAAVIVIALGIGASTTMLAFVDAALLRPLPYPHPTQLVDITESAVQIPRANLSYLDYADWTRLGTSFSAFDVYTGAGMMWSRPSGAQFVAGARVTAGFFRTLGVEPALGRGFRVGEDAPDASATVIVSHGLWQQFLGGRMDVVGQSIVLGGTPRTIVGVLPASFEFAPAGHVDIWAPMGDLNGCERRRSCHNLYGVARLQDHATVESARAEMTGIADRLAAQYPDSNRGQGASLMPLASEIVGDARPTLLLLLAGVGLLQLIACLNVAGLLLVRTDGRQRELAVRQALGASRRRLLVQFVTEAFVLVAVGSGLGLSAAASWTPALVAWLPDDIVARVPYLQHMTVSARLIMVTAGIVSLTVLILTVAPFLRMPPVGASGPLVESGRGSSGRTWRRLGARLVIAELVIAVVLLVGAGLLGRSAYRLMHASLNFEPDGLATIRVAAFGPRFEQGGEPARQLQEAIRRRVGQLPGVTGVATTSGLPVSFNGNTMWIRVVGQPYHGEHNEVNYRSVSASYFDTLGVRQVRGRRFTEADDPRHPNVAIINDTFARRYFGDADPVGQHIGDTSLTAGSLREIVGVIGDLREGGLDDAIWPALYLPFSQDADSEFVLLARTATPPAALLPEMESAIRETDRDAGTLQPATMAQHIDDSPAAFVRRSTAWLVTAFAAVAWVLGVVGLYGVLAYLVSQRTREIGVRLALGADRRAVSVMVVKEATRLVVVGAAAGLAVAVWGATFMRAILFNTAPWDGPTLLGVVCVLIVSAVLASYIPARRAAAVNPIEALRAE